MILVSVGSFVKGFDALVTAADTVCAEYPNMPTFAQIGHSAVTPQHMAWARFISSEAMQARLQEARLLICHGGLGIIGDGMRAGLPIIAVPRTLPNMPRHPMNDQRALVSTLQERYGITGCEDLSRLGAKVAEVLETPHRHRDYAIATNIPEIIAEYLREE